MAWNGHQPQHRRREFAPACERAWKVAEQTWLATIGALLQTRSISTTIVDGDLRRSGAKEFAVLEIRVLGGLEVVRDGVPATLPRSRKTRALLAYLALARSRHRREQLCYMFWDVPDDPRGSLRWSLSKIRPIVDEVSVPRLLADRQSVELRSEAISVDFLAAQSCADLAGVAVNDLADIAKSFR